MNLDERRSEDLLSTVAAIQHEVAAARLDLSTTMHLIAARAQHLTRAEGAAVELVDGTDMIIAAGTGIGIASVGLRIPSATSMAGLCVLQREVVWSDDVTLDQRVDWKAVQNVGHPLRSMVLVPLIRQGAVAGVLLVSSPRPRAFSPQDRHMLEVMGSLLATSMNEAAVVKARHKLIGTPMVDSILQAVDVGTFDWNLRADRIVWSSAMESLYGLQPGAFEGTQEDWLRRVSPRASLEKAVTGSLKSEAVFRIACEAIWPDGSSHPIETRGRSRWESGRPIRLVGTSFSS